MRALPAMLIGYSSAIRRLIGEMDQHFVRLMRNWARAGGGNSFGVSDYQGDRVDGDNQLTTVPILLGEASDVDKALPALEKDERETVQMFWIFEGNDIAWFATELNCHRETVVLRLKRGHYLLKLELARLRAERDRIIELNRQTMAVRSASIIDDEAYARPFARPVDFEKSVI